MACLSLQDKAHAIEQVEASVFRYNGSIFVVSPEPWYQKKNMRLVKSKEDDTQRRPVPHPCFTEKYFTLSTEVTCVFV